MLDIRKLEQYGFAREINDIKGITMHETGNYDMNAQELFNYLNSENKTSQGCHFLVDENEVVDVMPISYGTYHTGKGMDYGNKFTIAIEICSNISTEKYERAEQRAIDLVKELMEQYNISKSNVFFHKDFNQTTYCPKTLLDKYGTSKEFANQNL